MCLRRLLDVNWFALGSNPQTKLSALVSSKGMVAPVFLEKTHTHTHKRESELPLLHLQMTRFLKLQMATQIAPQVC